MSPLAAFLLTVLVVVAAKTGAWVLQLRTRNAEDRKSTRLNSSHI